MKKALCATGIVFVLTFIIVLSSNAKVTSNEWNTATFTIPNPCNGLYVDGTEQEHFVYSEAESKDRIHQRYHYNYILTGEDEEGNMYYGEVIAVGHGNENQDGTIGNATNVMNISMESDTGQDFIIHAFYHLTLNAHGEVTAEIEKYEVECPE